MAFHYFKTNQPFALLFYAPWAAVVWLPFFMQPYDYQNFIQFKYTTLTAPGLPVWALTSLGMVCILIQAYQFNRIINRVEILGRESQHHGAVFIWIASMIYPGGMVNDQMISGFFVLAALNRWWGLAGQRNIISLGFDAAFLTGIATLIYTPNAFLMLLAFAALMLFRTFNPREAFYMLLGAGLPLLFWFSWCFANGKPMWHIHNQPITYPWYEATSWLVWYGLAGLLAVISFFHYLAATPGYVIRTRKMRSLMVILLILAVACLGLRYIEQDTFLFPFMAFIPVTVFISGFLSLRTFAWWLAYAVWFSFVYAQLQGYF